MSEISEQLAAHIRLSRLPVECPICGAAARNYTYDRQHANGETFESVTYVCDAQYAWVPNFSRREATRRCPNSEVVINRLRDQIALLNSRPTTDLPECICSVRDGSNPRCLQHGHGSGYPREY